MSGGIRDPHPCTEKLCSVVSERCRWGSRGGMSRVICTLAMTACPLPASQDGDDMAGMVCPGGHTLTSFFGVISQQGH